MKQPKPILLLYTELAAYTIACLKELSVTGIKIHVVRWPINNEAPFNFENVEGVSIYNRTDYSDLQLLELCNSINPGLIICSGWIDKGYLKCCKAFRSKCNTVLTLDNHWIGGLKQTIKTLFAKYYFKSIFSHAWVPGEPQIEFTKKLGFNTKNTRSGFYCADLDLFKSPPREKINKKFLFVGRYLEFKGIFELWNAFIQFKSETTNDWELHCAGSGDLWDKRTIADGIVHHGFLQPPELKELVAKCDVFVLPSRKEPWGVVVHEMAASGLALICSDKIGATSEFLETEKNGYSFSSGDEQSLKEQFKLISSLKDSDLLNMSKKSQEFSEKITPHKWTNTALELMK